VDFLDKADFVAELDGIAGGVALVPSVFAPFRCNSAAGADAPLAGGLAEDALGVWALELLPRKATRTHPAAIEIEDFMVDHHLVCGGGGPITRRQFEFPMQPTKSSGECNLPIAQIHSRFVNHEPL
jgi:hypothetical protein